MVNGEINRFDAVDRICECRATTAIKRPQTESQFDHNNKQPTLSLDRLCPGIDSMMPGMMHHHGSHRGNVRADSTKAGGVDRATDTTSQCGLVIRASELIIAEFTTGDRCDPGDKVESEGRGSGVVVVGGRSARATDGRAWRLGGM